MSNDNLINESGDMATITGRRITILDVLTAVSSPNPKEQLYEDWDLSEEEVEAALEYVREDEEALERLRALVETDASVEEMRRQAREEAREQAEEHVPDERE